MKSKTNTIEIREQEVLKPVEVVSASQLEALAKRKNKSTRTKKETSRIKCKNKRIKRTKIKSRCS